MAAQYLIEMQKKKKRLQDKVETWNFSTIAKTLPLRLSKSTSFNDSILDISAT